MLARVCPPGVFRYRIYRHATWFISQGIYRYSALIEPHLDFRTGVAAWQAPGPVKPTPCQVTRLLSVPLAGTVSVSVVWLPAMVTCTKTSSRHTPTSHPPHDGVPTVRVELMTTGGPTYSTSVTRLVPPPQPPRPSTSSVAVFGPCVPSTYETIPPLWQPPDQSWHRIGPTALGTSRTLPLRQSWKSHQAGRTRSAAVTSNETWTEAAFGKSAGTRNDETSARVAAFVLQANVRFRRPPSATHSPQRRLVPSAAAGATLAAAIAVRTRSAKKSRA